MTKLCPTFGARPLALIASCLLAFGGFAQPVKAAPSLAQWLAGQRFNACYSWFLSGIGDTFEAFDPADVNVAKNTDSIEDGEILQTATVERVGSDTLRVDYDARRKLALFDHRSGESREEYLMSSVSPPPRDMPPADLSGIKSIKGLRLGTTFSRALASAAIAHGRPHVVRKCGYEAVVFQSNGVDCTNERDLIFKDRKLVAFGVGGNC